MTLTNAFFFSFSWATEFIDICSFWLLYSNPSTLLPLLVINCFSLQNIRAQWHKYSHFTSHVTEATGLKRSSEDLTWWTFIIGKNFERTWSWSHQFMLNGVRKLLLLTGYMIMLKNWPVIEEWFVTRTVCVSAPGLSKFPYATFAVLRF